MKKYAIDRDFYEMELDDVQKMMADVPHPNKEKILAFMRGFPHSAFTSQPVFDVFTGEEVGAADNQITDGVYIWYESWVYHFEKYNLKLNDDFIQYVLNRPE